MAAGVVVRAVVVVAASRGCSDLVPQAHAFRVPIGTRSPARDGSSTCCASEEAFVASRVSAS